MTMTQSVLMMLGATTACLVVGVVLGLVVSRWYESRKK